VARGLRGPTKHNRQGTLRMDTNLLVMLGRLAGLTASTLLQAGTAALLIGCFALLLTQHRTD